MHVIMIYIAVVQEIQLFVFILVVQELLLSQKKTGFAETATNNVKNDFRHVSLPLK